MRNLYDDSDCHERRPWLLQPVLQSRSACRTQAVAVDRGIVDRSDGKLAATPSTSAGSEDSDLVSAGGSSSLSVMDSATVLADMVPQLRPPSEPTVPLAPRPPPQPRPHSARPGSAARMGSPQAALERSRRPAVEIPGRRRPASAGRTSSAAGATRSDSSSRPASARSANRTSRHGSVVDDDTEAALRTKQERLREWVLRKDEELAARKRAEEMKARRVLEEKQLADQRRIELEADERRRRLARVRACHRHRREQELELLVLSPQSLTVRPSTVAAYGAPSQHLLSQCMLGRIRS